MFIIGCEGFREGTDVYFDTKCNFFSLSNMYTQSDFTIVGGENCMVKSDNVGKMVSTRDF